MEQVTGHLLLELLSIVNFDGVVFKEAAESSFVGEDSGGVCL